MSPILERRTIDSFMDRKVILLERLMCPTVSGSKLPAHLRAVARRLLLSATHAPAHSSFRLRETISMDLCRWSTASFLSLAYERAENAWIVNSSHGISLGYFGFSAFRNGLPFFTRKVLTELFPPMSAATICRGGVRSVLQYQDVAIANVFPNHGHLPTLGSLSQDSA